MNLLFTDTTLTNANQLVNSTRYTRQHLLDGIFQFFTENALSLVTVSDEAAPFVTAYGIVRLRNGWGYGLKVQAAPASCGTGIIFEAQAIAHQGIGWAEMKQLGYRAEPHLPQTTTRGKAVWSTSELLIQFNEPRTCPPLLLKALKYTVESEARQRESETQNQSLMRRLREQLQTNSHGEFHGHGYTGRLTHQENGRPNVSLSLHNVELEKMLRIIDILKE